MCRPRRAVIVLACLMLPLAAAACSLVPSGGRADLAPTLSFQDEPGGPVAFQSGQPVPTFDREPRLRADLDGTWRFDAEPLATNLTMSDRGRALAHRPLPRLSRRWRHAVRTRCHTGAESRRLQRARRARRQS